MIVSVRALRVWLAVLLVLLAIPPVATAQGELVASLEVLESGVDVRRSDTNQWVRIKIETLVGQGDSIRTDGTGGALVTFFADGTFVELAPNTEYRLSEFQETETGGFRLRAEVLIGITRQQLGRLLDPGSSYEVITPGAAMTARGTDFALRVEDDGRSSVLTYEGLVGARRAGTAAEIESGYGMRAERGGPFSEVVPATTFDELDVALDGCDGSLDIAADARLNVRLGPSLDFQRVGSIGPDEINTVYGTTAEHDWFRIPYRGSYAWVSGTGTNVTIDESCPGLPQYGYDKVEDPTSYTLVGEVELVGTVIAGQAVNLRSGPGLNFPVISRAERGAELPILGRDAESTWLYVRTEQGPLWAAAFLIRVDADLTEIGVVPVEQMPEEPEEVEAETDLSGEDVELEEEEPVEEETEAEAEPREEEPGGERPPGGPEEPVG